MYRSLDVVVGCDTANTHREQSVPLPPMEEVLVHGRHYHILEVIVPRAAIVLREKQIDAAGNIVELVVWRVQAALYDTSGVRYRLAFVRRGAARPTVLYDNHSPKGHHRHIEGVEEPYQFVDLDRLILDFGMDVRRALEGK